MSSSAPSGASGSDLSCPTNYSPVGTPGSTRCCAPWSTLIAVIFGFLLSTLATTGPALRSITFSSRMVSGCVVRAFRRRLGVAARLLVVAPTVYPVFAARRELALAQRCYLSLSVVSAGLLCRELRLHARPLRLLPLQGWCAVGLVGRVRNVGYIGALVVVCLDLLSGRCPLPCRRHGVFEPAAFFPRELLSGADGRCARYGADRGRSDHRVTENGTFQCLPACFRADGPGGGADPVSAQAAPGFRHAGCGRRSGGFARAPIFPAIYRSATCSRIWLLACSLAARWASLADRFWNCPAASFSAFESLGSPRAEIDTDSRTEGWLVRHQDWAETIR